MSNSLFDNVTSRAMPFKPTPEPFMYGTSTPLILQVKKDLERHEGYRKYAYPDPLSPLAKKYRGLEWGFKPARELLSLIKDMDETDGTPWTVGFGFTEGTTPDSVIERIPAERKLERKIVEMDTTLASRIPWYRDASVVTKGVLVNMAFNMGVKGLLGFHNTLRFISQKDYAQAARNMTLSLWYRQVGSRAKELVERMRTQTILPSHKAKERL
jgi:lysozyme